MTQIASFHLGSFFCAGERTFSDIMKAAYSSLVSLGTETYRSLDITIDDFYFILNVHVNIWIWHQCN